MPQVSGIIKVTIIGGQDGLSYLRTKENSSKLKTGGKSREAVVGGSVHGYVEKVVASEFETTLIHMADTDVKILNDLTDATLVLETDTGVTYTVSNAFVTEPMEINEGTGEMPLKMMGEPAVQG